MASAFFSSIGFLSSWLALFIFFSVGILYQPFLRALWIRGGGVDIGNIEVFDYLVHFTRPLFLDGLTTVGKGFRGDFLAQTCFGAMTAAAKTFTDLRCKCTLHLDFFDRKKNARYKEALSWLLP